MLILNPKTEKLCQHITLSAQNLDSDNFVYRKKIGNYQEYVYVITKNNGKMKTETTLTLITLDFYH